MVSRNVYSFYDLLGSGRILCLSFSSSFEAHIDLCIANVHMLRSSHLQTYVQGIGSENRDITFGFRDGTRDSLLNDGGLKWFSGEENILVFCLVF